MTVIFIGSGHRNFSDFLRPKSRERLAAYGQIFDRVLIIAFTAPGFSPQSLAPNVTVYPTNSRIRYAALWSALVLGRRLLRDIPSSEEVVISAQDPFESGLVAWILTWGRKARLQFQVHTDFTISTFRCHSFLNRIRWYMARFLLGRADCIRAVSQRIAVSLENVFRISGGRVVILPIWTSAPARNASSVILAPELSVLVVSRLEKEKVVDDAIRAFQLFINRGGVGKLTIVGEGRERPYLEKLVHETCPQGSVRFTGWQDEAASFYASANVYLMTSRYEGWGISVAEAVGAGIPVVMTDVGLAGEMVKNDANGIVVAVGDTAAMAEALLRLYHNPELRERYSGFPAPAASTHAEYLEQYRQAMTLCRKA